MDHQEALIIESNNLWSGLGWLILAIIFCSISACVIYIIEKRYFYLETDIETEIVRIKHGNIQRHDIDSIEGILFHDVKV